MSCFKTESIHIDNKDVPSILDLIKNGTEMPNGIFRVIRIQSIQDLHKNDYLTNAKAYFTDNYLASFTDTKSQNLQPALIEYSLQDLKHISGHKYKISDLSRKAEAIVCLYTVE